jgi:Cu2+-exporting ATPase
MSQITLKIKGMSCEHCEMRVKRALESVEGVAMANADHRKGVAIVTLKPGASVDKQALIDAVNATEIYTAEA